MDNEYFTSNNYLAGFLALNGLPYEIRKVTPGSGFRYVEYMFCFLVNDEALRGLVRSFWNGEPVSAVEFSGKLKEIAKSVRDIKTEDTKRRVD